MPPAEEPRVGGYTIEGRLGAGGMGAVFRARHPALPGRAVALKVLHGEGRPSPKALARFEREVQALAAMSHPGVVRLHGGGLHGGRPYYVMELVEGAPLGALAEGRGVEPVRAARIVRAIADAVAHVHEKGVLHRDLKPENVIIEAGDRPRICDFGLAWIAEKERLTRTGAFIGTPAYASPEQIAGRADDPRVDVYGLGGLLWFALVGRPPFEGESIEGLIASILTTAAAPPSRANPEVPRDLDAICLRALEKDPAQRYPTAAAFRDDLDRFLADEPVLARPSSAAARLRRGAKRLPVRLAGGAALALAVAAAGIVTASRASASRAVARARDEALAPGQTPAAIRDALRALDGLGAPPDVVAAVTERLHERVLEERLRAVAERPLARVPARALLDLAEAALDAAGRADLVGEADGLAVGDALIDGRDAVLAQPRADAVANAEALLALARRLAARRLQKGDGDGAARALRAYADLAAAGAPRRPLGAGRLGVAAATSESLLADLAAARSLRGAAGARAAWLLVDLLASAGADEPARAALDAARSVAPDAPERPTLERVLAAERGPGALAAGLAALRASPRPREAAVELGRLFARNGAPAALEHAELADPSGSVAAALAADPPITVAPALRFVLPREAEAALAEADRLIGRAELSDAEMLAASSRSPTERTIERFAPHRGAATAAFERALALAPREPQVLKRCSHPILGRLSSAVLVALASRSLLECATRLDEAFNAETRSAGASSGRAYGERWDSEGRRGLEACARFDERLAEDLREDTLLRVAVAGGVPRADVQLADEGVRALRRLEELVEQPDLEPGERDRLAAEALVGIESLVRLGPAALPFRARLRRLALPAPLGRALAQLDLERTVHLRERGDADRFEECWHFYALAATEALALERDTAASSRGPDETSQSMRLYRLTLGWLHEWALALAWRPPEKTEAERRRIVEREIASALSWFNACRSVRPLSTLVGLERVQTDFPLPAAERRRLVEAYQFRRPYLLRGP